MKSQRDFEASAPSLCLVILTMDEERNIAACLESLRGAAIKILVVDSGSTDRTVEIAKAHGAQTVFHKFETHAKQWEWALANLPISAEWVLGLDADQRVTPELLEEISAFINGPAAKDSQIAGAYIKRRQVFRGKSIRHGGYYPKYLLKLFRADSVSVDPTDLVDHHFRVDGLAVKLKHDITEDNQNEADISVWIAKHNKYARLQAREDYTREIGLKTAAAKGRFFGSPDERVLRLKYLWNRLPLFVRPFLYFTYRYFFRLGFLDGKQGFIFHFMQAFWYRLLVDINLDQLRKHRPSELVETTTADASDGDIGNSRETTTAGVPVG
ncbi:MAG: glycosyltransferase family 2 protein [Blastocatellia bacterium]